MARKKGEEAPGFLPCWGSRLMMRQMMIGEDVPDLSVIIILVFTVFITCAIIPGTGQEYPREPGERELQLRQQ